MIPQRTAVPDAQPSFWRPAIRFLETHLGSDYRVEVVPTANHWESSYLPAAGIPLARGWYRQLDIADNPVLYRDRLTPAAYRGWLRSRGVRFVIVPRIQLGAIAALREARLVRSPASGLDLVSSSAAVQIYALRHATPLLTGPGRASVTQFSANVIAGRVSRPGRYLLRVNFTPYWSVNPTTTCISPTAGSSTALRMRAAGRFTLRAIESPAGVLTASLDADGTTC
jgi:hypothetical protein